MVRSILAVILGYMVMASFIFITFTGAYLTMGADGAFRPGSYEVSGLWILLSFVLGIAAAVAGGWTCAKIATAPKVPVTLAGIVVALGLIEAGYLASQPKPDLGPRAANVSNLEAMQKAQTPTWINLLNPLIGAAGVMLGARLVKRP